MSRYREPNYQEGRSTERPRRLRPCLPPPQGRYSSPSREASWTRSQERFSTPPRYRYPPPSSEDYSPPSRERYRSPQPPRSNIGDPILEDEAFDCVDCPALEFKEDKVGTTHMWPHDQKCTTCDRPKKWKYWKCTTCRRTWRTTTLRCGTGVGKGSRLQCEGLSPEAPWFLLFAEIRDECNVLAKRVAELEGKEYKPKNYQCELEDMGIVEKDGDFGEEQKLLLEWRD